MVSLFITVSISSNHTLMSKQHNITLVVLQAKLSFSYEVMWSHSLTSNSENNLLVIK